MAANDSETNQVISNLRACLLSMKGGIAITSLDRDYKILIGTPIPYRKLGFSSLEQFLKSIPNVSISHGRNGEMMLDAIPSKNTEHLAALIARQKSAPKKLRLPSRSFPPRRTAASSWKPPPTSTGWKKAPFSTHSPKMRSPLSVTVSNKVDISYRGRTYEKPERLVEYGERMHSSPTEFSASRTRSFEKPPRFLRLASRDMESEKVPYQLRSKPTSVGNFEFERSVTPSPVRTPPPVRTSPPVRTPTPVRRTQLPPSPPPPSEQASIIQKRSPVTTPKGPLSPHYGNGDGIGSPMENLNISPVESHVKMTPLQARLKRLLPPKKPTQVVPSVVHVKNEFMEAAAQLTPQTYSNKLASECQKLGLESPDYKIVGRVPSGEAVVYSCNVKVGDLTFSSFPEEHVIPAEAVQIAAKQVLQELSKLYDSVEGKNGPMPKTKDNSLIVTRIAQIVGGHPSGIWSTQIPLDYKQQFSEALPVDWIKLMGGCQLINVDHVASSRIILTPNEPVEDSVSSIPSPTASDLPSPKLPNSLLEVPEHVTLPEANEWDVYVTTATSTDEVWVRLIGEEYSIRYENMATDMEMHYMEHARVAVGLEVGFFYAVQQDGCWHRVQLLELAEQMALVFFVDHGDEDLFPVDMVHELEINFAQLPTQAVHCCLDGLEDFVDDPNTNSHLVDTIIGKTLVAEVLSRGNDDYPVVSLVLYDTTTDEDLNLNQVLAEKISQDAMAPQLPEGGEFKEVFLSHVSETGDLYLQIQSDSFNYLQTLMLKLVEVGFKEEHVAKARSRHFDPTKLYLARYAEDQEWYRASVVEDNGLNEVKVLFVDYGNTEDIPTKELYDLKQLSEALSKLPQQAINVNLHNVPASSFTTKMVARIRELIPENEPVLVKVVESSSGSRLPQVEIFKRITEDKQLVSINNTLALDPDLIKPPSKADSSSTKSKKRLERLLSLTAATRLNSPESPTPGKVMNSPFSGSTVSDSSTTRGLSPPSIPDIGNYFDVHVTMAANPGNFTVQPYKERVRLEKMMVEMQKMYYTRPFPAVTADTVKEGGLYAALHNDGHWYRVCVSNVLNDSMVSVYFCDFGDVSVLHLDKLQRLDKQFKELSYQAIKAKLSGIQPSHSDWSVEDCLMFQERVVEHQFVSIIKETGPDLLNPSDTVLGLKLIDTSGAVDIHIDQLLVEQHRAIFTSPTISQ